MRSSHVGSYPLEHSQDNMLRAYRDTVSSGITVPPIPQLRSFTEIYLDPLASSGKLRKVKEDRYEVLHLDEPTIDLSEVEYFLERSRADPRSLRLPVTGPLTLASKVGGESFMDSMIINKNAIFSFFVPYVEKIVNWASSRGIGYIFIDEPALGLIVGRKILGYSERELLDIYEEIFSGVKSNAGLHVCGRIPPLLSEILMRVPARYLSHEFHDTRENLKSFSKEKLEEYDKIISPGIVSAKSPEVESIEEVNSLLREILERFGSRIDLVSADCGFGGLRGLENSYDISLRKLKLIAEVASSFDA